MERTLLKATEVAQIMGVGRSLVYELIARGEIPSVRVGRCVRVRAESLQLWLENQETQGMTAGREVGGGLPPPPLREVGQDDS